MSIFAKRDEVPLSAEDVISRGRHAARLLDDEVLRTALDGAERKTLEAWLNAKETGEREAAWAMVHALQLLQRELRIIVERGEHASATVARASRG